MRNKFLVILCCSLCAQASHAENSWRTVASIGGGTSSSYNLGRSQTFPILNPITDSFYSYSPQEKTQTQGLFEAFVGAEHPFYSNWQVQAGLAYDQTGSYQIKGTLTQGADMLSSDQYNYQFKVRTRQILAQAKFMYPYRDKWHPYFLVGLGAAINTTSHFSTSVPPFITFTREYSSNTSSTFAYRLGLGVDVDIRTNFRLGVAYRFADLGNSILGSANIDGIPVRGTLSQSNVYSNEVLFQLSYITL